MKSVSQAFVDAVHQRSRHFKFKLDFGDFVLENLESVKTEGVSCDSSGLTLGTAAIGTGSFEGRKITQDVSGKTFRAFIGLDIDGATEWCKLGKYTVSDVKTVGNTTTAEFEDDIAKLDARYDDTSLTYPALATAVLGEIASLCGVAFDTSNVPSGLTIDSLAGYTCREAVSFIAQLLGCFAAVIPDTEKIGFKWYTDAGYTISTDNNLYMIDEPTCESEFTLEMISCAVDDNILTAGMGTAGLVEIENPLMTQARLDSVYESVSGLTYNAGKVPFVLGNPLLDVWDVVTVTYKDKTFKVPCMQISCTYEGGFKCDVEAYVRSADTDFEGGIKKQLGKLSTEIKAVSGEVSSKVSKDDLISEINQSPEAIKIKASRIDLQGAVTFNAFDADAQNRILSAQTAASAANKTISSWCMDNNETYIDGSNIYTGTITADKLKVDTLESICAKIGGFTIDATYLSNNTTSLAGAANSVYLGTNGISCGTTFKVTKAGALTATSGTIGGFVIGANTLYAANGCFAIFAPSESTSSVTRVIGIGGTGSSDRTFYINSDGNMRTIASIYVGATTGNMLKINAGNIDFYYDNTKVGRLGIADVNGTWKPTFETPFGVQGNLYMLNNNTYLKCTDSTGGIHNLIGISSDNTISVGQSDIDNMFIAASSKQSFKIGSVVPAAMYSDGLNFAGGCGIKLGGYHAFRYYSSSVYCGIDTHPLVLTGSSISFSGSISALSVGALTATSATINGTLTAAGATINGVATVNGLTVNGGATAYSLTTTYGVTCSSITATTITCGSYTTTADEISFEKQIKAKGSIMLTNNAAVKSDLADGASNQILLRLTASNNVAIGQSGQSGKCYMYGVYNNASSGTVYNVQVNSAGLLSRASSSRRTKHSINYDIDSEAYHKALMSFKTAEFCLIGSTDRKLGMIAEDVETACSIAAVYEDEPVYDARENVVGYRKTGLINNYDDRAIIQLLVLEAQRKDKEIAELRREINILKSIPIEEVI